jgi:hypothetical protein
MNLLLLFITASVYCQLVLLPSRSTTVTQPTSTIEEDEPLDPVTETVSMTVTRQVVPQVTSFRRTVTSSASSTTPLMSLVTHEITTIQIQTAVLSGIPSTSEPTIQSSANVQSSSSSTISFPLLAGLSALGFGLIIFTICMFILLKRRAKRAARAKQSGEYWISSQK